MRLLGLLLAVVGLVGQLSSGIVAQRADDAGTALAALANARIECHPAPPFSGKGAPRHRQHRTEPSLCPARLALDQPSFTVMPPAEASDAISAEPVRRGLRPPSRGPPAATARVGEPRAPPIAA